MSMTNAPLPGMGATLSNSDSKPAEPTAQPSFGSPLAPLVTMTDRAAEKATAVLEERGQPEGMLRVFVVGGGCSGHQYGMSIAEGAEATDTIVEIEGGVNVVVDHDSVPMISGAEIDYVEDLMKSGFTIYNPNAVSACACGSSFQTAGNTGTPRPCA
jgi:iron-sulfur cluster assembly protein